MPETPEGLLARLTAAGIAAETRHHPAVFTVAESRDLRGTLPGGHTKNLFLRPAKGDGPFLLAILGLTPGSVTPFGLVNASTARIRFVMDAGLMRHPQIWVHPLVNTASTGLAPQDLLGFLGALGHETRLLELDGA